MLTLINEKIIRKLRNVLIDAEVLRKARVEALRSQKKFGEWLEEAREGKIELGIAFPHEKCYSSGCNHGGHLQVSLAFCCHSRRCPYPMHSISRNSTLTPPPRVCQSIRVMTTAVEIM